MRYINPHLIDWTLKWSNSNLLIILKRKPCWFFMHKTRHYITRSSCRYTDNEARQMWRHYLYLYLWICVTSWTACNDCSDSYTEKCRDIDSWTRCLSAVKHPSSDLLSCGTVAEHSNTTQYTDTSPRIQQVPVMDVISSHTAYHRSFRLGRPNIVIVSIISIITVYVCVCMCVCFKWVTMTVI